MKLLISKTGQKLVDRILVEEKVQGQTTWKPLVSEPIKFLNEPLKNKCVIPNEIVQNVLEKLFRKLLFDRSIAKACQIAFIDTTMLKMIYFMFYNDKTASNRRKIRGISDRLVFIDSCVRFMYSSNRGIYCPIMLGYVPSPTFLNTPEAMVYRKLKRGFYEKKASWDTEFVTRSMHILNDQYSYRRIIHNGCFYSGTTWIFHNERFVHTIEALAIEYPVFIFKYRHNITLDDDEDHLNFIPNEKELESWKLLTKPLRIIYPSCGVYLVLKSPTNVFNPSYLYPLHL